MTNVNYVDHSTEIDDYGIARCICGWSYDPFVRSDVQYTREVADRHVARFQEDEHEADEENPNS